MEQLDIRSYLRHHRIITDGAFGTYFAEKYAAQGKPGLCLVMDGEVQMVPEMANYFHNELVEKIHREYIEAGANLIRTNTFALNTGLFEKDFEKIKRGIRESVRIARRVCVEAVQPVFIAGAIGPIADKEKYCMNGAFPSVEEEYYQIGNVFWENDIHSITFETMSSLEDCLPAIQRLKKEHPDLFIMVEFSANQYGYTAQGRSIRELLHQAAECKELDAFGLNCGVGPGHMMQMLKDIAVSEHQYLIALPNAGYPVKVGRQFWFNDSRGYFADKLCELTKTGMDIVGGCCGTTPEYIRRLRDVIPTERIKEDRKGVKSEFECIHVCETGFYRRKEKQNQEQKDRQKKKQPLIAVELAPPVNCDIGKVLDAAHYLEHQNVDVVTFPDSPSGRTRVDSVLMAAKVRQETSIKVMPHICCRDKNRIAMRSMFLGAHINDIHNLLIVTGDPVPEAARSTSKSVFNFDSVGLMEVARELNREMFRNCPLTYGGAINQGRRNLEVEIERIRKKMEAGATFFFTQPVFTEEDAQRIFEMKEKTGARILCGIMPLVSRKNALFMKNEMAGIHVPMEIVKRYPEQASKEAGEEVGISIAREMMSLSESVLDGYYFTFPFNRVHMIDHILR